MARTARLSPSNWLIFFCSESELPFIVSRFLMQLLAYSMLEYMASNTPVGALEVV